MVTRVREYIIAKDIIIGRIREFGTSVNVTNNFKSYPFIIQEGKTLSITHQSAFGSIKIVTA